jgi:hypothetical protein
MAKETKEQSGREMLADALVGRRRTLLIQMLERFKRRRGRPSNSGSRELREAAKEFEHIKAEMHKRGFRGKHGLNEKIAEIVVEARTKQRRGAPTAQTLLTYIRRSKKRSQKSGK